MSKEEIENWLVARVRYHDGLNEAYDACLEIVRSFEPSITVSPSGWELVRQFAAAIEARRDGTDTQETVASVRGLKPNERGQWVPGKEPDREEVASSRESLEKLDGLIEDLEKRAEQIRNKPRTTIPPCPACHGAGRIGNGARKCMACSGSGTDSTEQPNRWAKLDEMMEGTVHQDWYVQDALRELVRVLKEALP